MTSVRNKIVFALIGLIIFTSCGNAVANTDDKKSITIGLMLALDSFPIIVAYELGFFEAENLQVNIEIFASATERNIAFQTIDEMDGIMLDFVALATFQEAGFDVVIPSNILGLSGIIGAFDVHNVDDLRGNTVLMAFNSAMHYILHTALIQNGMVPEDVYMTEIPSVPTRMEMLLNNQGAAATLPEPFITIAQLQGLNIVATTRELGINPFGLGFRREAMEQKPDEFQAFFRAINAAVEHLNASDRETYVDMLIDKAGFPEHLRGSMEMPIFTRFELPNEADLNDVFEFARYIGFLTIPLTAQDVLFDPFAYAFN